VESLLSHTLRRLLLIAVCTLVVVASVAAAAPVATTESGSPLFNPPKRYYLALGDSITYGFQSSKFVAGLPPAAFNTGYVDVFADRLRAVRPDLDVVNYGCPGESTTTFLDGPCLFNTLGLPLHDPFPGSQLDAAVAFLEAKRGQVSPITLHLFGNDVNDFIRACGGDFDCIRREAPEAIAEFGSRLTVILDRLRAVVPEAEVIVIGGWSLGPAPDADVDPLIQALNTAIATVAMQQRAWFADMVPVFNPPGEVARITAICTLTLLCAEGDGHPSDAGYRAIAEVVFGASGYGRLGG
jgi:lysophospholipase L1-like esterase